MARFRRAKITTGLVESLAVNDVVVDTALPGFGVRRQGSTCVYFVRKFANGRRHYVTVGTHGREGWTEPKARQAALMVIASLRQGRNPSAERSRADLMPTLAAFARQIIEQKTGILKPSTLANYRSILDTHIAPRDARGHLLPACIGRLKLDQVTREAVAGLHRRLRDRPRAANHVLAIVSSLFSEAVAAGLVPAATNPAARVERYPMQRRQRFLTDAEFGRLGEAIAACEADGTEDPYALAALRLLILTGCRRDEILGARWDWVDLDRGFLHLPDSKTGGKSVFLSPAAVAILSTIPRQSGNPFIIVGVKPGQRWVGLRRVWVRIRQRAEIGGIRLADGSVQPVRLHDLRHSFASLLASGGASLPMIGKLLGHRNPATTARYAHLTDDPLRRLSADAGQRVAKAMAGGQ